MTVLITGAAVSEAVLADASYPPQPAGGCSCRSIQEGAGGVSYSYDILGVSCPQCEGYATECDSVDWWNSLTRQQRIAQLAEMRAAAAALATASNDDEPPF